VNPAPALGLGFSLERQKEIEPARTKTRRKISLER